MHLILTYTYLQYLLNYLVHIHYLKQFITKISK